LGSGQSTEDISTIEYFQQRMSNILSIPLLGQKHKTQSVRMAIDAIHTNTPLETTFADAFVKLAPEELTTAMLLAGMRTDWGQPLAVAYQLLNRVEQYNGDAHTLTVALGLFAMNLWAQRRLTRGLNSAEATFISLLGGVFSSMSGDNNVGQYNPQKHQLPRSVKKRLSPSKHTLIIMRAQQNEIDNGVSPLNLNKNTENARDGVFRNIWKRFTMHDEL
jgi:hypothetical protein